MFVLTRNGMSKDKIVAQQDALSRYRLYLYAQRNIFQQDHRKTRRPSNRKDLSDQSSYRTSHTVTDIARFAQTPQDRSDSTRFLGLNKIAWTPQDCQQRLNNGYNIWSIYKIGRLSDRSQMIIIFGVSTRSDVYLTVIERL